MVLVAFWIFFSAWVRRRGTGRGDTGWLLDILLSWRNSIPECSDCRPCTEEVDRYCGVFDQGMSEEDSEDVEDVVAVISEGKWMDDGI